MAPSFLRDLRRRSKASFRTDRSTDESSDTNGSTPSTSTLNSAGGLESTTPPLTKSGSASNLQNGNVPPSLPPYRPTVHTSASNRYSTAGSVSGMSGLGSPAQNSSLPTSPYAPRILSIADKTWVIGGNRFRDLVGTTG